MDIILDDILLEQSGMAICKPRPNEIGSASGKFGKAEVECAADLIIEFFKKKGFWVRLTLTELMKFAEERAADKNAILVGLVGYWVDNPDSPFACIREPAPYFVMDAEGGLYVTRFFIEKMRR